MTKNSINNTTSDLQVSSINISGSTISTTTTNTNLTLTPNGTGKVSISGAYTLPSSDGTSNQVLQSDGISTLTFATATIPISQINIQIFTASGTCTFTVGMKYCFVEIVGGGAGGGACQATSSTECSNGGGGGGGGYCKALYTAATVGASQAVTVGAAGAGGNGGASGAGGTSTFGSFLTATGGGSVAQGLAGAQAICQGSDGGVGSGATAFINATGIPGEPGYGVKNLANSIAYNQAGAGGGSKIGSGGDEIVSAPTGTLTINGNNATGFGAGGGGAIAGTSSIAGIGGNGFAGIIIVTEYI